MKDDSDLKAEKVVAIADSENAYFDLLEASKNYTSLPLDGVYDPETDQTSGPFEEKIFNSKALELFKSASLKTKFQDPAWLDLSKVDDTTVNTIPGYVIIEISEKIIEESKILANAGKIDEAIDNDLSIIRVGQLLSSSSINTVQWSSGLSIEKIGLQAIIRIKPDYKLPINLQTNQNKKSLANALKVEYAIQKKYIFSGNVLKSNTYGNANGVEYWLSEPVLPGMQYFNKNYYFKPNKSSNLLADHFRILIRNSKAACDAETERPDVFTREPDFNLLMVFKENSFGKLVADSEYIFQEYIFEKQCKMETLKNILK